MSVVAADNRHAIGNLTARISALLGDVSSETRSFAAAVDGAASRLVARVVRPMNATLAESRAVVTSQFASVSRLLLALSTRPARLWLSDALDPWLRRYGNYRTVAGYVLGFTFTAVAAACLVALPLGVCGAFARAPAPTGKSSAAPACSRERAVTALRFAAGVIFVAGWALILVMAFLFVVGGIGQLDVCRHLVRADDTTRFVRDTVGRHLRLPFSLHVAMETCAGGGSVYTALGNVTSDDESVTETTAYDAYRRRLESTVFANMARADSATTDPAALQLNNTNRQLEQSRVLLQKVDFSPYRVGLYPASIPNTIDDLQAYLGTSFDEFSSAGDLEDGAAVQPLQGPAVDDSRASL